MRRWDLKVTASFSWLNNKEGNWPEVHTTAEWVSIKMRRSAINTDYLFDDRADRIVQLVKQLAYRLDESWQG